MIRHLAREKHLFLDYELIEQQGGLELKVHPARKQGIVLRGEHPWESGIITRPSVIEHAGRYHMWYNAIPASQDWEGIPEGVLCYAVSDDGVHWEKPDLGLCEWQGSRKNNIVLLHNGGNETCVFQDLAAPEAERFRLLATYYLVHVGKVWGVYLASSPDGLRWSEPKRVLPFCPDTMNTAFYDEALGKYVVYVRGWAPWRMVARIEVDDIAAPWPFETPGWSREKLLEAGLTEPQVEERLESSPTYQFPVSIACDDFDPSTPQSVSDIYTPAVMKYQAGAAYFAFPALFVHREWDSGDGPVEVQLGVSRDGGRFWRPDRSPYLPLGPRGSEDGGMLFMGAGFLGMGDEIYQYYSARGATHSEERHHPERFPMKDGKPVMEGLSVIGLAVQEKDRFIGLAAGRGGGELVTAPFTFEGNALELDVDCGATGWAKVEILDERGYQVWEYDLASAERIYLNQRRARAVWKKGSDLSRFERKPVRLRILLKEARLYGMQFVEERES